MVGALRFPSARVLGVHDDLRRLAVDLRPEYHWWTARRSLVRFPSFNLFMWQVVFMFVDITTPADLHVSADGRVNMQLWILIVWSDVLQLRHIV